MPGFVRCHDVRGGLHFRDGYDRDFIGVAPYFSSRQGDPVSKLAVLMHVLWVKQENYDPMHGLPVSP